MEEDKKDGFTNGGNYSVTHGWFNKTKQTTGGNGSGTSFWKVFAGVLTALAAIAGIITFLIKAGILSSNL